MRRRVTLFDSLVLLALGLVATCLCLPVVEAARQEARNAGCVMNLRMIGLATHNYYSMFDTFPMGSVTGPGRGRGQGCFTSILPFLERNALYNSYNFSLENWSTANTTAVATAVAIYLCPDNRNTEATPAGKVRVIDGSVLPGKFAALHYGANWGGERAGWSTDFEREHGTCRGVMMPVPMLSPSGPTTNIAIAQITDGTSFTIAVGEKRSSFGWGVGGWGGTEFEPGRSPAYAGDDPTTQRVYTGSYHESPNFLMVDGQVRALSATIDRKIWYALITRDGGEVVGDTELPPSVLPARFEDK